MRKLKYNIGLLFSFLAFASCGLDEIDNYDAPDASIHGGIYDNETGELVEQDILNGVSIEFIEHGFDNPQIQYMVVKNDGTYRNDLIFSGTYTMAPVRGNFLPVEQQTVQVTTNTLKNFVVQPYIRLKDVDISRIENKVVATFRIDQTITKPVNRIALFAHEEPNVGEPLNSVSAVSTLNVVTNNITEYRLEINLDAHSGTLKSGKQYYFRVGALINAPEAKFNYAPPVRLTL